MELVRDERILIALEHHAAGLAFDKIAEKHGLNPKTVYYRYRAALTILGLTMRPKSITADDIGLAVQRRFEAKVQREQHDGDGYFGTPQWMFHEFERERRDDERKALDRMYGERYFYV